jgi:hypothetical protein
MRQNRSRGIFHYLGPKKGILSMRGRPKPTSIKVLTGNPGKRRLNHDEPKPPIAIPECPNKLSPAARASWDRLGHAPVGLRMLTALDRAALAA